MVVEGKLKGLVHILGVSLIVGVGEGSSLDIPANSGMSRAESAVSSGLNPRCSSDGP